MMNSYKKPECGPHVPLWDAYYAGANDVPTHEALTTVATPVQYVLAERALMRTLVNAANFRGSVSDEARLQAALSDDETLMKTKPHSVRTWADAHNKFDELTNIHRVINGDDLFTQ